LYRGDGAETGDGQRREYAALASHLPGAHPHVGGRGSADVAGLASSTRPASVARSVRSRRRPRCVARISV
jgi:hypothetical protein